MSTKNLLLYPSVILAFLIGTGTGICQTVVDGDFECKSSCTAWTNCGSGATEIGNTESNYGGSSHTNNVAEVDNQPVALCQTISGFTSGSKYTLSLDLSRRESTLAPTTVGVKVCVGTTAGTGSCATFTRNNTTFGFTTSSFTVTAPATGSLILSIEPVSSYYSGGTCVSCDPTYGMIVDNVTITPISTPVTLSDFKAINNGSWVDINWQTATEINNDYFTVEKSKNGIDFTTVGTVDGAGKSQSILNYQTTDHSPYNGISYYRLKQTDFDGKVSYSKIEAVNFNDNTNLTVYPNPNTGIFNIQGLNAEAEISVQNPMGQVILIKKVFSDSSEIDLSSQPSGVYFIKVNNGDALSYNEKIIIYR